MKKTITFFMIFFSLNSYGMDNMYKKLKVDTSFIFDTYTSENVPLIDSFNNKNHKDFWMQKQRYNLKKFLKTEEDINNILLTVHYEALRSNLKPELILSIIETESRFKKYSVSPVGAKGFMQIMPFWIDTIGLSNHNVFNLRTNIRYGCLIFKHYLDLEKGNIQKALQRYNGSLGSNKYSDKVLLNLNKYL